MGLVGIAAAVASLLWGSLLVTATPSTNPSKPDAEIPAATVEAGARSEDDEFAYATFQSQWFAVSLRYPNEWQAVYPQGHYAGQESYRGEDGFFTIAVGGSAGTVEGCRAVIRAMSGRQQPYGQDPTIEIMEVAGQDACLIWPSDDQDWLMYPIIAHVALLLVNYPPRELNARSYPSGGALWLGADTDHIMEIASRITFTGGPLITERPGFY